MILFTLMITIAGVLGAVADIQELSKELESLRSSVQDARMELLGKELEHKKTVTKLQSELDELKREKTKVEVYDGVLLENEDIISHAAPVKQNTNFALFSAKCSSTVTYSPGQTILFNRTDLFFGGDSDFNFGTGEYTCPVTGVYKLYVHFYNVFNEAMSFDIRRGTGRILTVMVPRTDYDANNIVSIRCAQGEKVFIRAFADTFRVGPDSARFSMHYLESDI